MNVFYIKRAYHQESDSKLGSYYEITENGSFKRIGQVTIENALEDGKEVYIKPANKKQLQRIEALVLKALRDKE